MTRSKDNISFVQRIEANRLCLYCLDNRYKRECLQHSKNRGKQTVFTVLKNRYKRQCLLCSKNRGKQTVFTVLKKRYKRQCLHCSKNRGKQTVFTVLKNRYKRQCLQYSKTETQETDLISEIVTCHQRHSSIFNRLFGWGCICRLHLCRMLRSPTCPWMFWSGFSSWTLGNDSFIVLTLSSMFTQRDSTHYGLIYESNRTVLFFAWDYYYLGFDTILLCASFLY